MSLAHVGSNTNSSIRAGSLMHKLIVTASLLVAAPVMAGVNGAQGSYQDHVGLAVPEWHGVTPRVGISYSSSQQPGKLGVGWSLDSLAYLERMSPGGGAPTYDDNTDVWRFADGSELVACTK